MNLEALQTASNALIAVGVILSGVGGLGQYYFGKQLDRQKEAVEKQLQEQIQEQKAALALSEAEQMRRGQLLAQLRNLYILSNDGLSPEMLAGVAPLPKEWVEQKLKERGETWRQDSYY